MAMKDPPQDSTFGRPRPSPLGDRIAKLRQGAGRGLGALFGGPSPSTPPDEEAPAPAPEEPDETQEGPQGVNRGALLARLQGTHRAHVNRGFYALLQATTPAVVASGEPQEAEPQDVMASDYRVILVDTEAIEPNPYRTPVVMDAETLNRLVQNIKEQGILEPLQIMPAVSPNPTGRRTYWVISGERRRQAALRAGIRRVPVIVRDVSPRAGLQMFLSQYVHTRSIPVQDRARAYATLASEMGMSVGDIALRIGATVEQIETELAFLKLEAPILDSLLEGRLRINQAEVLLKAPDQATRMALWQYALRYGSSPERMLKRLDDMRRLPAK